MRRATDNIALPLWRPMPPGAHLFSYRHTSRMRHRSLCPIGGIGALGQGLESAFLSEAGASWTPRIELTAPAPLETFPTFKESWDHEPSQ